MILDEVAEEADELDRCPHVPRRRSAAAIYSEFDGDMPTWAVRCARAVDVVSHLADVVTAGPLCRFCVS